MATVITNKGLALLSKLTQGNALEITSAKTGAGTVDASLLMQQTGVNSPKQTMSIKSTSYPEDGKCALILSVTNDDIATGYTIMQIGIYANDPDEGEVLFSIWQIDSGSGINIPSKAVLPGYNAEMHYNIVYDQADSVNVNVDPSNTVSQAAMEAYVTEKVGTAKEDISKHTANKQNPHGVTAAQLGLAKVATSGSYNDLSNKPTIPAAYSHPSTHPASMITGLAKVATSGSYNDLSNKPTIPSTLPANGGNADTVDNKHASDFAPATHDHKYAGSSTAGGSATSAEKLAAAKTIQVDLGSESAPGFDGTANVSPGVKGTLPIKHGGTGANTAEQARENLGIITKEEIPNLYVWKKYAHDPSEIITIDNKYSYVVAGDCDVSGDSTEITDVYYSDEITIVAGELRLVNPVQLRTISISTLNELKGKYLHLLPSFTVIKADGSQSKENFIFLPESGKAERSGTSTNGYWIAIYGDALTTESVLEFKASKTSDTYPTSGKHTDGYWYEYHKQIGDGSKHPNEYAAPAFICGTEDLEAGVSSLETGKLYLVYE